jgi:hypothetical protein
LIFGDRFYYLDQRIRSKWWWKNFWRFNHVTFTCSLHHSDQLYSDAYFLDLLRVLLRASLRYQHGSFMTWF